MSWRALTTLLMAAGLLGVPVAATSQASTSPPDAGSKATPPPPIPRKDFTTAQRCRVLRIVRGDTLIVRVDGRGKRVGLVGLTVPPPSDLAGAEAQRALTNLLKGEFIYLEFVEEPPQPDRFGRLPAYVYRAPDGLFVNLELVRQGYAAVAPDGEFAHRRLFEYYEEQARRARKGRWGPPPRFVAGAGARPEPAPATAPARAEVSAAAANDDVIVYVTANGTRYHRAECYHLRKSRIPLKLSEAKARGYKPCAHCKPPE